MSHIDESTLQAFLDGELGEPERREVGRHLEVCDDCRVRFEEAGIASRRASDLLAELEPGPLQAPTWSDLEERAAARAEGRLPRRWPRPALAWAASILLAFAVGWWLRSFWEPLPEPVRVATVQRHRSAPPAEGTERLEPETPEPEIRAPGPMSDVEPAAAAPGAEPGTAAASQADSALELEPRRDAPGTVALQPTTEKLRRAESREVQVAEVGSAETVPAEIGPAEIGPAASGARQVAHETESLLPPAESEAQEAPDRLAEVVAPADQPARMAQVRTLPESALRDAEAAGSLQARSSEVGHREAETVGRPENVVAIQPEEAPRWLGGELRILPDLRLQRAEVVPGSAVEGGLAGRAAVRLVYTDAAGHELTLVQQLTDASAESGTDTQPALLVEPNGRKTYRWHDAGYLLLLQGEVSSDSLRALAEQVR